MLREWRRASHTLGEYVRRYRAGQGSASMIYERHLFVTQKREVTVSTLEIWHTYRQIFHQRNDMFCEYTCEKIANTISN